MKIKIAFLLILFVTILTRFYKLGSFPSGMTWDETAIGYSAYGLITNHRDEWLHRTPIVFQSFGDFKSPLLIYIETIPVVLLGLTPFAVRLPVAMAGVGLVITSFFLALEILKDKKSALVVMALVALSPWAIHFSRIAFESMLATFLVSLGVYFFLRWTKSEKFWHLAFGIWNFALALYAYHSAKVVLPLIGLMFFGIYRKTIWGHKKQVCLALLGGLLVLVPLIYATFFGNANARALSTTIFSRPNPTVLFVQNYARQLSPGFLFRGDDITYRHSTRQVGVLYPIEALLFIAGIILILTRKDLRVYWWVPACFFIGLIPASLGLDVPHANRALLALPWIQLTAGIVVLYIAKSIRDTRTLQLLTVVIGMTVSAGLVQYQRAYTAVYSSSTALHEFGYGYDQVMQFVRPKEGAYDRVYFSNAYGQAYIYILFYKKLTPMEYQHGGLANYTVTDHPFDSAKGETNVLIVGTQTDIPDSAHILQEIRYPDGQIAWRIAEQ